MSMTRTRWRGEPEIEERDDVSRCAMPAVADLEHSEAVKLLKEMQGHAALHRMFHSP